MMEAVDNVEFDVQKIQTFLIGLGSGGAIGIITGAAIKVRSVAASIPTRTRSHPRHHSTQRSALPLPWAPSSSSSKSHPCCAKTSRNVHGWCGIPLQVSQFFGFVDVRWDKVTESALPILDINEDGLSAHEGDTDFMPCVVVGS